VDVEHGLQGQLWQRLPTWRKYGAHQRVLEDGTCPVGNFDTQPGKARPGGDAVGKMDGQVEGLFELHENGRLYANR
jgi:hypothetical protein